MSDTANISKDTTYKEDLDYIPVANINNSITVAENDTIEIGKYFLYFSPCDSIEIKTGIEFDSVKYKTNFHERAKTIELLNLKKYDVFKRNNDSLALTLMNGEKYVLTDKSELKYGDGCKYYTFYNYYKENKFYLIAISEWEDVEFLLIDINNGKSIKLIGIPFFNSNFSAFFSVNSDIDAGLSFNGIQYCKIEKDTITEEFRLPIYNLGPKFLKWVGENEVIILKDEMPEKKSYSRIKLKEKYRVGKGESHPQTSHRTVLEPLDSHGSS